MLIRVFPVVLALAIAIGVLTEIALTRTQTLSIAAAIKDANTSIVQMHGRVTPISPGRYLLTDTTGTAEMRTCPTWYRTIILDPGEEITVTGEIIKGAKPPAGTSYSFDAYTIFRKGKPDIVLRTAPGKPPWALNTTLQ